MRVKHTHMIPTTPTPFSIYSFATHPVLLALLLGVSGCSSVGRMERDYRRGDAAQLERLTAIVGSDQHSYATRKKAAHALGAIGDRRAVGTLIGVLFDSDPRDGLEIEAASALGKIKDERAVGPLLRCFVSSESSDLRKASVAAIGSIGGRLAAESLVEALRYYTALQMQSRMDDRRRLYETAGQPTQQGYGVTDSLLLQEATLNSSSAYRSQAGPMGLFGEVIETTGSAGEEERKQLAEEEQVLNRAFLAVGKAAVPILTDHLGQSVSRGEVDIGDRLRGMLTQLTVAVSSPVSPDTLGK